ncbi:adenylate kinase family protein [Candidatus Bathyarchaeota archaeon]|nr:adenylate kinase family protein [Candidatus Bathyarchaeota archaeon]
MESHHSKLYNNPSVVIITGTPGVGKTVVSEILASKIGAELVSVGELVKKEKLYTEIDKKRQTFVADLKKVSNQIRKIIACSTKTLIVEGHYAVDVVSKKYVSKVFVLRRDPEELRETLRNREYGNDKIHENLAAEILDVCLYNAIKKCGVNKVCEINVTGKTIEEVAQEILQIMQGKKKCRTRIVDWLGKLYAEEKIDEFLKDF